MRPCILIPALNAAGSLGPLLTGLHREFPDWNPSAIIVIDDGSSDETSAHARAAGATVVRLPQNQGKGAALVAGLRLAQEQGFDVAVSVDADGQHPPSSVRQVLEASSAQEALVLGIRDLQRAGAPRANQRSNAFSNAVLSRIARRPLRDTQCGLRRYPIRETLALGAFARGYAFEAEVLLLAAATAMPIVEVDIDVLYPPASERVTHFHVVKDPARIVGTVVRTALRLAWRKRGFRWVMAVTALVCGLACLRAWVRVESAPPVPPLDTFRDVAELQPRLTVEGDTRRAGEAFVRSSDGILQVFLDGAPERRGAQHGLLLGPAMEANERALWKNFSELVPWAPARFLLTEWGRFRYRSLHRNIPPAYLREIAAQVVAAQTGGTGPSPRNEDFPDYERALFLHGLYDIALSFEHSPLIGCTVLALGPEATASGHPLVARAFDFEAGEIFDREKAVFFVREEGRVPYASVAWPGLVGVLTGMNAAGVYLSVNGARAGTPRSEGLPVVFGLREALARATTTGEAVEILLRQEVMVSHLVFVADASGTFAVVERVPGQPGHVRTTFDDPQRVVLTNHFEGPFAEDPRNRTVKETTSTLGRRKRGEELVQQTLDNKATPTTLLSMLRDHKCAQSRPCALGDRNTIDAFIATHGVLADTANQVLWVSVYPHLSGRFVPFALKDIFASYPHPSGAPAPPTPPGLPVLPEDTETPRRPAP